MQQIARSGIDGGIGIITIDSPPVNALGTRVRRGLEEHFNLLLRDPAIDAIVLICEGRTFFAGADISEFGKPPQSPTLLEILALIENAAKPVIAAIHGSALGGGLELALVCHYRIALPSAKLGLPEVHLGLLPGGGGTQRLPRVIGVDAALDLMVSGRMIGAAEAHVLGILDELAREGRLRDDAIAFARRVAVSGAPLVRIRDRNERIEEARARPGLFAAFRAEHAGLMHGFKAPDYIVRAVEAAVSLPFEEGITQEWALFRELEDSVESAAQRHVFFGERETSKIADISPATPALPLHTAAVIGSGEEARSILGALETAGFAVTAFSSWQHVVKGNDLAELDILIEATPDDGACRDAPFPMLGGLTRADAILVPARFRDLEDVAAICPAPDHIVGLRFPSPANKRLLEILRGPRTSASVLAAALRIAKSIGKVPVVSRSGTISIADRLSFALEAQIVRLEQEGIAAAQIARALKDFGFPVPPSSHAGLAEVARDPIIERLLLPVVNEGAKLLDEGVAGRASDVDMVAVLAHGWPAYRGGPMFWADGMGLTLVTERLRAMAATLGPALAPAPGLVALAAEGGRFTNR